MSPPRPAVIVLLLVILALVVFFVVGQGLGAQQRRGTSQAEISSLKERVPLFGGAPRVRWPSGPPCPQVSPSSPCTFDIPRGKSLLRKVSVTTTGPMSIDFVPASTPDRTVTLDLTKDFSKPAELSVDYKGGRLALKCVAPLGSACNVTVR